MPNGDAVANFSIATTQRWKDKGSGEDREETEWSKIVFYRKQAEIAGQYLKKGAHVCVQGRMRTRKWADKNGVDRYTTEIVGTDLQMLGRAERDPETSAAERPAKPSKQKSAAQTFEDLDSDVPFAVLDTYHLGQIHLRLGPEKSKWRTHAEGLFGLRRGKDF